MEIRAFQTGPIGTNTYIMVDLATNKGFIVDPGGYTQPGAKQLLDEGTEIEYIILTHGHGDHMMGVERFLEDFPNAKVVAHEDENDMLHNPRMNSSEQFGAATTIDPDIWVKDGDSLDVGGLHLEIMHTPGHSPGGMCIYNAKHQILFSGDTLFRMSMGRVDLPGGDYRAIMQSLKKLAELPEDTRVLPGHMNMTTIGYEKENNPYV